MRVHLAVGQERTLRNTRAEMLAMLIGKRYKDEHGPKHVLLFKRSYGYVAFKMT